MKKRILSAAIAFMLGGMLFAGGFTAMGERAQAAGTGAVNINSVTIGGDSVNVNVSASDLPDSDDGQYYLFAEKVYQGGPAGNPVASAPIGPSAVMSCALGYNTASNHLYDKFQVAVKQGGTFVPVTGGHYITNPEALAGGSAGRRNGGKKGLILDGAKIGNGNTEVVSLGVQQGAYNINIADVVGGNGAITYNYNGKTYGFDSGYMSQYDHVVRVSSSQGMGLTMVLLNPYARGEEFLISPHSRGGLGRCPYYMMNTSEDKGLEYLEAVVSFLAQRYNGQNGYGQVDNWIIANEVNAKNAWNYCAVADEMAYAQLYADSVRVCYNAIKSRHANAYVCISVDQNWTKVHNPGSYYSARSMIEAVNYCIQSQGNIDWGLAEHPYNCPMNWTPFWTPKSETMVSYVQHNQDTAYLTMENIEVLTDYMAQPQFRNTKGAVRPILLTEVGYTSTQGEEAQAAMITYAYQRVMTNQYLNMIIFNRQTDAAAEIAQGLAVGLTRQDGSHKLAFEFYQHLGDGGYVQRAAGIIGIADWNVAMHAR